MLVVRPVNGVRVFRTFAKPTGVRAAKADNMMAAGSLRHVEGFLSPGDVSCLIEHHDSGVLGADFVRIPDESHTPTPVRHPQRIVRLIPDITILIG